MEPFLEIAKAWESTELVLPRVVLGTVVLIWALCSLGALIAQIAKGGR